MHLQKILFPIDFSEQCRRTAPFVKAYAVRFDADVLLLHVMDLSPYLTAPPGELPPVTFIDQWRLERRALLDRFLAEEFEGVRVVREMVEGDTAYEIVNCARSQQMDLIMIPTHGLGRFRALLLGSVAAKVLHDAECPVWTAVHTQEEGKEPDHLERILCAVDLATEDVKTAHWAREFTALAGGRCTLVHAIPGPEIAANEKDHPARRAELNDAQKAMVALFGPDVTEREIVVEFGRPSRVIHRVALAWQADVVVIGRGKMRKPLGAIRSDLTSIIHESPCPVISYAEPETS